MTQTKKKLVFSWVLILSLVISVISPGSALFAKAEETGYQTKLTAVTKCLHDYVEPVYSGEWALLQQARQDNPDKKWLHKYYYSLVDQLNDEKKTAKMGVNDWARVILAVEALGEDPADFNGKNLFENLSDYSLIESFINYNGFYSVPTISYILMGVGGREDTVFSSDKVSSEVQTSKDKLKDVILSYYDEGHKCWRAPYDGEDVLSTNEPDVSAQAIQGLAAYYNKDEKVKSIINDTLETLSGTVDENGCVIYWYAPNVCATAQVLCALTSLGIDPRTDQRYVKNGKTLVDGLCTFFDPETGGVMAADWTTGEQYLDLGVNTVQAGYALTAYDRFLNNKSFVFDMSDVKEPIYHYGGKANCVKKAVCDFCGQEYGEKDPKNHTGNVVYKNIKAATFTEKGYTGDKVCADCGEILEKGTETDKVQAENKSYSVINADSTNVSVEYTGADNKAQAIVTIQNTVKDTNGVDLKVTKIADNAFAGNTSITDVTIGTNVTEIGANAFKNCTRLTNIITQNEDLTTIGASAFAGAKALTEIDFSESSLKTIDINAFSGCKKLKTIKLNGNKLTKVGKNAFKNVKKNAKITIYAKNKKTYNKVVKLIKKSGAKKVKYAYKKKK